MYRIAIVLLLLLNLCCGYYVYLNERDIHGGDTNVMKRMDTLLRMVRTIRENYIDVTQLHTDELLSEAMHGMEKKLDAHSNYFQPRAARQMKSMLSGKFGGIGIISTADEGKYKIIHVNESSPAEKAGLLAGDEILSVDDLKSSEATYFQLLDAIRGQPGTKVKITVQRQDEQLSFDIERTVLRSPSISGTQIIEGTTCAYLNINSFTAETDKELKEKLTKLLEEHSEIDSLIIDLRGNGGGFLEVAVKICSLLLPEGQFIVKCTYGIPGKTQTTQEHYATAGYKLPDTIKVAVLIDCNSASASEVTAGCLQDLKRAIIVGEKSYGKGSIQELFELGNGNALKLTVGRYHTPDETRVIDGVGITPDIECKTTAEQKMRLYRRIMRGRINPARDPQIKAALDAL